MGDGIVGRRIRFKHNGAEDEGLVMAAQLDELSSQDFALLVMTEDGDLCSVSHTDATVLADGSENSAQPTPSSAHLKMHPLTDMQGDEHGGFMQRVRLCPGTEAYLHLIPMKMDEEGQQPDNSVDLDSPYMNDYFQIIEGMDGPLHTIESDGQEFLFFLVPCMK